MNPIGEVTNRINPMEQVKVERPELDERKVSQIGQEVNAPAKEQEGTKPDVVAVSEDGDTVEASKAGVNASTTVGKLVAASEDGAVTRQDEQNGERTVQAREDISIPQEATPQTANQEQKITPEERAFKANEKESQERREEKVVVTEKAETKRNNAVVQEAKDQVKEDISLKSEQSKEEAKVDSLVGYTKQQVEMFYREGRISRNEYDQNMEAREERMQQQETSPAGRTDEESKQRAEQIEQTKESNDAFMRDMSDLNMEETRAQLTGQGMQTAMNSGREAIMEAIFTQSNV